MLGNSYIDGIAKLFDVVITTQAEFDALVASPTWLDAKSVALVGDGGNLKFNRDDTGVIIIPPNVKRIEGFNDAIIDISNIVRIGAMGYQTKPTDLQGRGIRGITLIVSSAGHAHGFYNCVNLVDCNARLTILKETPQEGSCCFRYCDQLHNCNAVIISDVAGGSSFGYYGCQQITNSSAEVHAPLTGYGFDDCDNVVGSTATVSLDRHVAEITENDIGSGVCFIRCNQLVNCNGTAGGFQTYSYHSYGMYNCHKVSNCHMEVRAYHKYDMHHTPLPVAKAYCGCLDVANSQGIGYGPSNGATGGKGFHNSNLLVNCRGSGICFEDHIGQKTREGYGFYGCQYMNNCRQYDTIPSTNGFLGGACTKVDNDTVLAE